MDWTFLNPKVGATVPLRGDWQAYASYGRTTREPTRSDLFAGDDDLNRDNVADYGDPENSMLDAVLEDAKRVQRGLTKTDTDKLDEYFQSIRDIEVRLGKDEQWLSVPKAKAPVTEPK